MVMQFKLLFIVVLLNYGIQNIYAQNFSKQIEGKKFIISHNPDAPYIDEDFEKSEHYFQPNGKYTVKHPNGKFEGMWHYDERTQILEIRFRMKNIEKKFVGRLQEFFNDKFILDLKSEDGNMEEMVVFLEK
jgi:hypothetical protein